MNNTNKFKAGLIIACICMSMYLNIENVLSLMLYDMSQEFTDISIYTIQKIPSNMYLIEAVASLGIGWLASKLSKRKMVIIFQGGTVLGALIGFFFGKSFFMVYVSLFVLSISCAVMSTICRSVVVEVFTSEEVPKMISVTQIANTIGTSLLQILGGYLVVKSWRWGYLAFLVGLLSLFSAIFMLPEGPKEIQVKDEKTGKKANIWTKYLIHDVVLTLLILCITTTFTTTVTFLVAERGFGNSVQAGWLSGIQTAFKFIAAVLLAFTAKITKKHIISVSSIFILIGFLLVGIANNIWLVVIGAALSGFGFGTFTPSIFVHIANHVLPETNSESHAMIAVAGTLGSYLYPYIITLPSRLFGTTTVAQFQMAILLLIFVIVGEVLFQRNENEY